MPELNFVISQHFLDDRWQRAGFILLGAFLIVPAERSPAGDLAELAS